MSITLRIAAVCALCLGVYHGWQKNYPQACYCILLSLSMRMDADHLDR